MKRAGRKVWKKRSPWAGRTTAWSPRVASRRLARSRPTWSRWPNASARRSHSVQCRRIAHGMVGYAETGDPDAVEASRGSDLRIAVDDGLPWASNSHGWLGLAFFLKGTGTGRAGISRPPPNLSRRPPFRVGSESAVEFRCIRRRTGGHWPCSTPRMLRCRSPGRPIRGDDGRAARRRRGPPPAGRTRRAASFYDLVVGASKTPESSAPASGSRLPHRTAAIAAMAGAPGTPPSTTSGRPCGRRPSCRTFPAGAHAAVLRRDAARPGRRSDRAEAARVGAEAADLYRRMGMPRHLAMVEAVHF